MSIFNKRRASASGCRRGCVLVLNCSKDVSCFPHSRSTPRSTRWPSISGPAGTPRGTFRSLGDRDNNFNSSDVPNSGAGENNLAGSLTVT